MLNNPTRAPNCDSHSPAILDFTLIHKPPTALWVILGWFKASAGIMIRN